MNGQHICGTHQLLLQGVVSRVYKCSSSISMVVKVCRIYCNKYRSVCKPIIDLRDWIIMPPPSSKTSLGHFGQDKHLDALDSTVKPKSAQEEQKVSWAVTCFQVCCGCPTKNGQHISGLRGHPSADVSFATTLEGMWPTVWEIIGILPCLNFTSGKNREK